MPIKPFQAKLFAYEISRQMPSNNIGKFTASLQDAQVDLNPHQVDAAMFAFKSPLSNGALLADEVGLGKTILKVKQKVSGMFKTDTGADTFSQIQSIAQTAKKNNQNPFLAILAVANNQ